MKKSSLLLLLFVFFCQTTIAQETLKLGFKGGVNFSDYTGRGGEDYRAGDSRTSFHAGLLGEINLSSRWNIQPELLYSRQGFVVQLSPVDEINLHLDYLQLPVLGEFRLVENLYLQAGPQVGYLLKEDRQSLSNSLNYNRVDLSAAFGAEYRFQSFLIYGRYTTGINRIYHHSEIQMHHRVIQIGAGFAF